MRIFIVVVSVAALLLAATLAALGPGVRAGLWSYGDAFSMMRFIALPLVIAAGLALLAVIAALAKARGLVPLALVALIAAGAASSAPLKMKAAAEANPFIHDVTTDFENPPAIIAAADLPRQNPPGYVGAEKVRGGEMTVAEAQMQAFPELTPIISDADIETATNAVRAVLADMKMQTLAEGPADDETGGGWRVEAVATSFWYGFKDDFIVRLTPTPEGGSRIDVRSKSRVGGSDLGANAARADKFLTRVKERL